MILSPWYISQITITMLLVSDTHNVFDMIVRVQCNLSYPAARASQPNVITWPPLAHSFDRITHGWGVTTRPRHLAFIPVLGVINPTTLQLLRNTKCYTSITYKILSLYFNSECHCDRVNKLLQSLLQHLCVVLF